MTIPIIISGFGCVGTESEQAGSAMRRRFPLESLPRTQISVNGHTLNVWVVRTPEQREEGLMWVTAEEIGDDEGMLFVFPDERYLGFWMKNTLIPLGIAYARFDGRIVATHVMPPLTLQTFPSYEPAIFALEMKAAAFERLKLRAGDRIEIPNDVFKGVR